MPFNAISGCASLKVQYDFRGQQAFNNLWALKTGGAITVLDATTLANTFATYWATNIMPNLSNDLTLLNVTVRDQSTEFGVEVVSTTGTTAGAAADALPNNVAACVSVRTGFAGRHYRGRFYLPGIPRGSVVENDYDPAFAGDVITTLNTLVGVDGYAPGWQGVVVARWQTLTPLSAPVPIVGGIVTPVNAFLFTDTVVDSQRRRLPGRGK